MKHKAGVASEPFQDSGVLMRGVVLDDDVDRLFRGHSSQLSSFGGAQRQIGSFVHSPDSHDRVRRGIRKGIEM